MIIRGTTQTQYFNIPFIWEDIVDCYVSYEHKNKIVLEKTIDEISYSFEKEAIQVDLSQNDTLSFPKIGIRSRPADGVIMIQIRVVLNDGRVHASAPIRDRLFDIIKDGYIGD